MRIIVLISLLAMPFISRSGELESIEKQHQIKMDKAKELHEKKVKQINQETIRRYTLLLKQTTRAGNLKEAIKIQNRIAKLKGEKPLTTTEDEDESVMDGDSTADKEERLNSRSSVQKHKKRLTRRYVDFHRAMIDQDKEKCLEFVDPQTRKMANDQVIMGYINLLIGAMQIHKIEARGVKLESDMIYLSKNRKEAKVVGHYRAGHGRWHESEDPMYWVLRRGEWYIGDKERMKHFH